MMRESNCLLAIVVDMASVGIGVRVFRLNSAPRVK